MAWANYFDDVVTFASVAGSIKFVFKALGWLFAHSVNALGVRIDVQNMHCGVDTMDNTAGCKGDLLQILDDVILSNWVVSTP